MRFRCESSERGSDLCAYIPHVTRPPGPTGPARTRWATTTCGVPCACGAGAWSWMERGGVQTADWRLLRRYAGVPCACGAGAWSWMERGGVFRPQSVRGQSSVSQQRRSASQTADWRLLRRACVGGGRRVGRRRRASRVASPSVTHDHTQDTRVKTHLRFNLRRRHYH